MTEDTFRIVITIGVGLACLFVIVQAGIVFAIYRTARQLQEKVVGLVAKADPILDTTRRMVDDTRPKVNEITDRALEITTMAKSQVARLDEMITETSERARLQIDRIDNVIIDTVDKVSETTSVVQHTILRPVREVNGVVSGLRAALSTLARGNRASVNHATQDEEMFI